MRITHLAASNWRNFKNVEFDVGERLFVVGPNAVGKSNLLDVFRFLADIVGRGGGLASAIERRGGLGKVRSLFSRTNAKGRLVVDVRLQDGQDSWRYRLSVKGEGKGRNRPVVDEELVMKNGEELLRRPDDRDREDEVLLTQTHLEQIASNQRTSMGHYQDTDKPRDPAAGGARALAQQRNREDPALDARPGTALLGPSGHPVHPCP